MYESKRALLQSAHCVANLLHFSGKSFCTSAAVYWYKLPLRQHSDIHHVDRYAPYALLYSHGYTKNTAQENCHFRPKALISLAFFTIDYLAI